MIKNYINTERCSLEAAQAVYDVLHRLKTKVINLQSCVAVGKMTFEEMAELCSYIITTLDIESLQLVEDILDEMDKEDEGGII